MRSRINMRIAFDARRECWMAIVYMVNPRREFIFIGNDGSFCTRESRKHFSAEYIDEDLIETGKKVRCLCSRDLFSVFLPSKSAMALYPGYSRWYKGEARPTSLPPSSRGERRVGGEETARGEGKRNQRQGGNHACLLWMVRRLGGLDGWVSRFSLSRSLFLSPFLSLPPRFHHKVHPARWIDMSH